MIDKSVVLFAYNAPHKKTQDFIFRILSEGYKIKCIIAADLIKLAIPPSSVRTKLSHGALLHPSIIARNLGIKYIVSSHDNIQLIRSEIEDAKVAVIGGARILNADVINLFPNGIINFHPGIIPNARGLDALLWSILNLQPLGVTAHLVDRRIDAGKILKIMKISVSKDDTIFDISERLYELQLDMIKEAIELSYKNTFYTLDDYGGYNKKMPPDLEAKAINSVEKYKELYAL